MTNLYLICFTLILLLCCGEHVEAGLKTRIQSWLNTRRANKLYKLQSQPSIDLYELQLASNYDDTTEIDYIANQIAGNILQATPTKIQLVRVRNIIQQYAYEFNGPNSHISISKLRNIVSQYITVSQAEVDNLLTSSPDADVGDKYNAPAIHKLANQISQQYESLEKIVRAELLLPYIDVLSPAGVTAVRLIDSALDLTGKAVTGSDRRRAITFADAALKNVKSLINTIQSNLVGTRANEIKTILDDDIFTLGSRILQTIPRTTPNALIMLAENKNNLASAKVIAETKTLRSDLKTAVDYTKIALIRLKMLITIFKIPAVGNCG